MARVSVDAYKPTDTGAITRTIHDRISDLARSVRDFGAVGDGTTDDRVPIQACVDAVYTAGGGTVYIPPGTYLLTKSDDWAACVRLRPGVHIVGSGVNSVLKLAADQPESSRIVANIEADGAISDIYLGYFKIDGNNAGQSLGEINNWQQMHGVFFSNARNITLDHLWIYRTQGDCIYFSGSWGLCYQVLVSGCHVWGIDTDPDETRVGININGLCESVVYGNTIRDLYENWGVKMEMNDGDADRYGVVIANNSILNTATGIGFVGAGNGTGRPRDMLIVGNRFKTKTTTGLSVSECLLAFRADRLSIIGNTFDGGKNAAIGFAKDVHECVIQGNSIRGVYSAEGSSTAGIYLGGSTNEPGVYRIRIADNLISDVRGYGIIVQGVYGAGTSANEVQRVSVGAASAGTFLLEGNDQDAEPTVPIAFDASAATVKEALVDLLVIGPNDVSVELISPGTWDVTFRDRLGNKAVGLLGIDGTGLTGGTPTVVEQTAGVAGPSLTRDIDISGNIITETRFKPGILLSNVDRVRIHDNMIVNNRNYGVQIASEGTIGGVHNGKIAITNNNFSCPTGGQQDLADIQLSAAGIVDELTLSGNIHSGVADSLVNPSYATKTFTGDHLILEGWWQDDVAASQTDVALTRAGTGAAFPTVWVAPRPGHILGVSVKANAARAAGTLTVTVFKNGSTTGLTAVLDAVNTTSKSTYQGAGLDTFVVGDELDIRITTDGGWLPTTADVRATIEVEL